MAERVESEVRYEERPSTEFVFPDDPLMAAGPAWISAIIEARGLELSRSFGGFPSAYEGLNRVIQNRMEGLVAGGCDREKGCQIEVDATAAGNESEVRVSLSCGVLSDESEEVVDIDAVRCRDYYAKCRSSIGHWLIAAEASIANSQRRISAAEEEISTAKREITDLA